MEKSLICIYKHKISKTCNTFFQSCDVTNQLEKLHSNSYQLKIIFCSTGSLILYISLKLLTYTWLTASLKKKDILHQKMQNWLFQHSVFALFSSQ